MSLFVVLAACATAGGRGSTAPTPAWLAGTWLMIGPDLEFPLACASGLPIAYRSDGTYGLFDEEGTWRLEGDRLTETMTEILETAEPEPERVGRPYQSRIRRTGPNAFMKTYADGATELFRRCPSPQ